MGAKCTGNRETVKWRFITAFLGDGITGGESFSVNFGALYPR